VDFYIALNGEILTPIDNSFYELDLQAGDNVIEFKFEKPNPRSPNADKAAASLFLSLVDLEYIFTPVSLKIEAARRAIEFLDTKYDSYNGQEYLEELDELESNDASMEQVEAFQYMALVANNPELDFAEVLFRQSGSTDLPPNWRANSHYLRRAGEEFQPEFDDSIRILNLQDGSLRTIYQPTDVKEGLMDFCLDFDGERLLYSGIDTATNTFQVYEMDVDGSNKTLRTPKMPTIDNYNGIYLPNGRMLFCSTASLNSVPCVYGKDYVGTLFEIEADGSNMRQVAFDQENDWYPWVQEDGRVMYHRWEYTDNSHYFTRILMEMNPDGTNNRSIYGSNSYWPNTLFYAKQIPGQSSKFSAIVSGHHGEARAGELWVFDSARGDFEADGALRKIPGHGRAYRPRHIDQYATGKWPLFVHPYPISENFFLVAGIQKPGDPWRLYLVDTFDNMIQLHEGEQQQFEPIPLKPRERPPVVVERINWDAEDATLEIQDIYAGPGLEGVPRGEVAALRIFTYGYAYRQTGAHDGLAVEGGWDTKRILGTVPVEEDGSVRVKIPHSMPLSIQPIDKDGRALQVMRSWLAAQPGENVSCVGCHEPSSASPIPRPSLSFYKPPQELTPWSQEDRPYGFGFQREIQPILDTYCVGCHDGTDQAVPNFADTTEQVFDKAHFSTSYLALHPFVRRPGPESDLHILAPMDYHASTSELFQMLEKGHHGVEVDEQSMRQLYAWVDLNVPYHATWMEYRDDPETRRLAELTVEYKKLYANIDDDIEWMPSALNERPEFILPIQPDRPTSVRTDGWPLNSRRRQLETKAVSFGDQELTFVKIPAGRFVMGSIAGSLDESPQAVVEMENPFWMSTTEITNAQFREFKPDHDSRFIDQQWKDHIYAGYPADKPEMPAVRVTWNEAQAFTEWLGNEFGGKANLPTEAQWEWAARAGSDQPFFFGTTDFERYANLADENIALLAVKGVDPQPVPVAQRTPLNDYVPRDPSFDDGRLTPEGTAQYNANSWGLFDMHGNVAEWTRSSYRSYPYVDDDGRNDLGTAERKVARGGSWRDRPKTATASYRLPYLPFQRVYNVGFRIVIEDFDD
jgi:formylglycine-generating enzyme required for sulfatase activity